MIKTSAEHDPDTNKARRPNLMIPKTDEIMFWSALIRVPSQFRLRARATVRVMCPAAIGASGKATVILPDGVETTTWRPDKGSHHLLGDDRGGEQASSLEKTARNPTFSASRKISATAGARSCGPV